MGWIIGTLVVVLALQAIAAAELLGREGGWLGLVVALCAGRAALALVALPWGISLVRQRKAMRLGQEQAG